MTERVTIKGKLWGDDAQALQEVSDIIVNEFAPDAFSTLPRPSSQGGYHVLFTVYKSFRGYQK